MHYLTNPRKIFDVLVDNKRYGVYDIPGKEHQPQNEQGPSTWWLLKDDKYTDLDEIPEDLQFSQMNWIPYDSLLIPRLTWDIRYTERVRSHVKWNRETFRTEGRVTIICNGRKIYGFWANKMEYALSKAQSVITELLEHPFNFINPMSEQGRPIYYHGLPARIGVSNKCLEAINNKDIFDLQCEQEPWEIKIIPDPDNGMTVDQWFDEYERILKSTPELEDYQLEWIDDSIVSSRNLKSINHGDAFHDKHIIWFRSEVTKDPNMEILTKEELE